jgi:tetratricopeptide (TPR) repeat protein
MSINQKAGQSESITSPSRALQLFTDRYDLTHLFIRYINDDLSYERILFFHGDGGNGKSLLLRFLREKCCKRLSSEQWQGLKAKSAGEIASYVANLQPSTYIPTPSVLLDFDLKSGGGAQPQDPFYGLLMLRRNLAESVSTTLNYHLRFPLYDFACVWYLHKKGKSPEEIRSLFPLTEVAGFVTALSDAVTQSSAGAVVKAFFDFFAKDWGRQFTVYRSRLGLKREQVEEICQKDLDRELIGELPRLLAQDLNAAMSQSDAPKRIVLFLDSHEAFWGIQRNLQGSLFFQRDEWLRYFLAELELSTGISVVLAGREPPTWAEADNWKIPTTFLEQQRVHHLSAKDGIIYLQHAGVTNSSLQDALIDYASVEVGEVHPLYLGLCADVVLQAQKQGTVLTAEDFKMLPTLSNRAEVLINLLLKYVDRELRYAVHSLSACRAFNRDLFRKLGQELNFLATEATFDILKNFSFVWQAEQRGQDWYRIHDLLRRLDYEVGNEIIQRAHQVLSHYYQEQEELVEFIYHVNRIDWQQGVLMWTNVFDHALRSSDYEQCRALLGVRNDLIVKDDFLLGGISHSEGDYYMELSRYAEAEQEYLEAIAAYVQSYEKSSNDVSALQNKAFVLEKLGNIKAEQAQYLEAIEKYEQAIATCNQMLGYDPNESNALNTKGLTLKNLGDLQRQQAEYSRALASYQEALSAYNQAIALVEGHVLLSVEKMDETGKVTGKIIAIPAHNMLSNKGDLLTSLGNLLVRLSRKQEAVKAFEDAIDTFDQVLEKGLHRDALNNKGLALRGLGRLLVELCQEEKALEAYQNALSGYEQILAHAPEDIYALDNKGFVLDSLGDLQTKMSQHSEALQSYQQAIAIYNQTLSLAPNYTTAINHKGSVLSSLGDLQIQLSQYTEASRTYQQAIETYDQALAIASNHIHALKNKELALMQLAHSKALRNLHAEALQDYYQALYIHNRVFANSVDDVDELRYKGQLFHCMGSSQDKLSQASKALENYKQGIVAYKLFLSQETDVRILVNYCQALKEKANLYFRLSQLSESLITYEQAIKICDQILNLEPNRFSKINIDILESKGSILLKIAGIQEELLRFLGASQRCEQAIVVFDQILDLTIGQNRRISTLEIKTICQRLLGKLYCQLAKNEEALQSIQQSITTCDQILNYDSTSNDALKTKAFSLQELGELQLQLSQPENGLLTYQQAVAVQTKITNLEVSSVEAHHNLGSFLQKVGDLHTGLFHIQNALASYEQAIAAYEQALLLSTQRNIGTLLHKGLVFKKLGELTSGLLKNQEALSLYQQSIDSYEQALRQDRNLVEAYNNQGLALISIGRLQESLVRDQEALASYKQAIRIYDQALRIDEEVPRVYNNKGSALKSLGDLQVKLFQTQEALQSYQNSIRLFEQVLSLAPDYVDAYYNKGNSLKNLGELQTQLVQYSEATQNYVQSIAAYDHTLEVAPNDIEVLNNKGLELKDLGILHVKLSLYQEALQSYQQSIVIYDQIIGLVPGFAVAHYNKGFVFHMLGELETELHNCQEALEKYTQAITSYDQALNIAPNKTDALNNKGLALRNLGSLNLELSRQQGDHLNSLVRRGEALYYYQQAITTYEQALEHEPENSMFINNKATTLRYLGDLFSNHLSTSHQALESYNNAVKLSSQAIQLSPRFKSAYHNKAISLSNLGFLQMQLSLHPAARLSLEAALGEYSHVLEIDPDDDYLRNHIANLQVFLNDSCDRM